MSELAVQLTTIDEVKPHPNADRLEIAVVGGWQCAVPKGEYTEHEAVLYFPPDTVLPQKWTDQFGVTQYCHSLADGNYRIRCARLRGEPSFGVIVGGEALRAISDSWPVDTVLDNQRIADYFSATKYTPPVKSPHGGGGSDGLTEADHLLFPKYTEIENIRNYPNVLLPNELIMITEKIDGTNCRVGVVRGQLMAGSHNRRLKVPECDEDFVANRYLFPLSLPNVRALLLFFNERYDQVILFGEVFGAGVQRLDYGRKGIDFVAFDLLLGGGYASPKAFKGICNSFGVPMVPELATLEYHSLAALKPYTVGRSMLGGTHIREGIVIKPTISRQDPRIGRVVLKYISDDYLLKKYDDISES